MKKAIIVLILLFGTFIVGGYLLSDDLFFRRLIAENKITNPDDAFNYLNSQIEYADKRPPIYGLTPRYMLTERKNLWCDEGAIVLAILNNALGYKTRLVDVIGDDNDSHHTYLEVLQDNSEWKTYDTVKKRAGLTHEEILGLYKNADMRGYPRPRQYPRLHNYLIQYNFFIKQMLVWYRGTPG